METRTLRATLHSGTTAAGNGTAATNPTGGGLILGTLSGSGSITASVVVEISAAGSVWVPLREPERINGAGSVPVQIYYSTTAAQVRLRVVDITGTLSVGLYAVGPEISTDLKPSPDGSALVATVPIVAPSVNGISLLPDGSTSFGGPVRIEGGVNVGASAQSAGGRLRIPLNRRLRCGTFSDSTNNGYTPGDGQPALWDMEAIADPIPATGATSRSMPAGMHGLSWLAPVQWVANGGVDGNTTTQALDRSAAAASSTNKSMQAISSKRLDVLFCNGMSINDLTSLDTGSDIAAVVDPMIIRDRRILAHFSPLVDYIIWTGIFGAENTTWTAGKGEAVRAGVVMSWQKCAALAAEFPNVIFINPNGVLSDNGIWRPGVNVEPTNKFHLSPYGGHLLAKMQKAVIDQLYTISNRDAIIYDLVTNWFTPSGSAPNVKPTGVAASAAGGGSAVIGASEIVNGEWRQKITTTGNTVECLLATVQNLKTLLAGKVLGDKFYSEIDIDCYDETGAAIPFRVQQTVFLYEVGNAGNRFVTQGACNVDSARMNSPVIALDRDASTLGTTSSIQVRVYPDRVGETTIVIRPPRLRAAT